MPGICFGFFQTQRRQITSGRHFSSEKSRPEKITVNKEEFKIFQNFEKLWWDEDMLRSLHEYNRLRVPRIKNGILTVFNSQYGNTTKPLQGITVLDIGCGGGLLSESLARLGAQVTGLDPVPESIEVARQHAEKDNEIINNLEYICGTVEEHCKGSKKYDAVVCSEVLDHVDNVPYFVKCCIDLAIDNGYVHFATINRTGFAYLYSIFLAEKVFRFIPKGSHHYSRFIKTQELRLMLETHNCRIFQIKGTFFNPITKRCHDISYNGGFYSFCAVKEK